MRLAENVANFAKNLVYNYISFGIYRLLKRKGFQGRNPETLLNKMVEARGFEPPALYPHTDKRLSRLSPNTGRSVPHIDQQ